MLTNPTEPAVVQWLSGNHDTRHANFSLSFSHSTEGKATIYIHDNVANARQLPKFTLIKIKNILKLTAIFAAIVSCHVGLSSSGHQYVHSYLLSLLNL